MNFEFMTIGTPLPPCMPFPRALLGFPVSSTAKVMYCRMLDAMLSDGQEDENGILFVCFPVAAIAAALSRSTMTVKRSLNELETAGLIMRVRRSIGEPNRIYVLIPSEVPWGVAKKPKKLKGAMEEMARFRSFGQEYRGRSPLCMGTGSHKVQGTLVLRGPKRSVDAISLCRSRAAALPS